MNDTAQNGGNDSSGQAIQHAGSTPIPTTQTPISSPVPVVDQPKKEFNVDDSINKLETSINQALLPKDLHEKAIAMLNRLKIIKGDAGFFLEYDSISRYIEWITNLPWNRASEDILDLAHAKQVLDHNHYGLNDVKQKIMEYLAIMIRKKQQGMGEESFARAPIISLVGLVGVGKTTIAYSIAESLGRKIVRIPFGGMGSASQLRGKTRLFPDAEPGLVIKALRNAGTNNPVILLDEIDRVSAEARADIMGVLVELLDPTQNKAFTDHFIDYPFNLQNVLFIATSNNTKDISTAVLDRLEIIQMPSYTDQEKITIAKNYMFPKVLKESGLTPNDIVVEDGVWEEIVRPLGYDSGIRSLERIVQGVVRKVVFNQLTGKIPTGQFHITAQNVKEYVPAW
ncbi:MAG TPA: AAA family ATPase [Patescibacteria group bacterium]|nr:AAA family ATPase [Patescibacteria group bacterium]